MDEKRAQQLAEERTADNLMNFIIAKTFSRHAKMTEEEFLKDIGFEGSGKPKTRRCELLSSMFLRKPQSNLSKRNRVLRTQAH